MIWYDKYGENVSNAIMFLHGTNFVHCFSKQTAYFARKCQVIVPHLPGFGRSSDLIFSADLAVEQAAEIAKSIKHPVTLVGFSLGAQLCLPLMCRHGELFNGIIMISPWLIKDIAEIERYMRYQANNEKAMRNGVSGFSAWLSRLERQEHREFCQSVSMRSILASIDNGLLLSDYPDYAGVEKPIMAICGMKETTNMRRSVRELAHQNPNCVYEIWDGAGHNIPLRFAPRLNKTIESFTEKIASENKLLKGIDIS